MPGTDPEAGVPPGEGFKPPESSPPPKDKAAEVADEMRTEAQTKDAGDVLEDLAGPSAESAAPERAERGQQVEKMQELLRGLNNDPATGRRMLAEIPLGDGTDRVAMILRPDAIRDVSTAATYGFNDATPEQIAQVTPDLQNQLDGSDTRSILQAAQHKMLAVLPEVGPVAITPTKETAGMIVPGSLKSEVMRLISTQGATANGTFLELMGKEGLKFVKHTGMETDDSASYIKDDNTSERMPSILHKDGDLWEGDEVPGATPIRGREMSQLFDASIIAARAGAREEQKYQGPSPDHTISNSLNNLQALASQR